MYRVLYRKWRPERFSDVIGQEHVTATLKNEIRSGRISHAYLFTGSRGTGKTSCAKILSRAVNCLDSTDGEPCGKCRNCQGIINGSILDVVEMDAASNNSVNNIRTVLDEGVFTPSDAKYRVYIIDEVHMLSPGAFNALLKTLEEPPSHVVFILATTEINKIPATILSRCQRFDFNRIDASDIAKRLVDIAKEENVTLTDDGALLIAAVADGAMRDALSILDRCIGLSDTIDSGVVREATGLAGRDYLFTLADAVSSGNVPLAINTVNTLHKASKSMSLLCEELSQHFRALMLIKTMKKQARSLIIMTPAELEKAELQSERFGLSQIINCIETLQSSRELMFRGGNNRIEFETCMIKLCSPRLSTDISAILARLEKLERTYSAAASSAVSVTEEKPQPVKPVQTVQTVSQTPPAPKTEEVPKISDIPLPFDTAPAREAVTPAAREAQVTPSPAPPAAVTAEARPAAMSPDELIAHLCAKAVIFEQWEDVLEALKATTRVTATAFKGTVAYTAENYVLIYADSDVVKKHLQNATHRMKIREAITRVTGRSYKLGPYKPPGASDETDQPPRTRLGEFIENVSNSDTPIIIED